MRGRGVIIAIITLLGAAWLLACGDSGQPPLDIAPPAATYDGPLAAYAVVKLDPEPLSALYLKAVDPATGEDLAGRAPVELGHHGTWALSPDGTTMALAWAATGNSGSGPERFFLFDTITWEKRDLGFAAHVSRLFWSPAGDRLYATTYHRCEISECVDNSSELVALDPETGDVITEDPLPYGGYHTDLSPDGATLYIFGSPATGPEDEDLPPRLVAFDIKRGETRAELDLPDVLNGWRLQADAFGEYGVQYLAGVALSLDGRRYYVAHANEEKITVIDLASMDVDRTVTIGRGDGESLAGRILGLFADTAEAKGGATTQAALSISANGRFLYRTSSAERPTGDATVEGYRDWESVDFGLQVIDASTFSLLAEDVPPTQPDGTLLWADAYRFLQPDPTGRSLLAVRGAMLRILDPETLVLETEVIAPYYDFLVGPAPASSAAR
jgi:hypothetical protein